MNPKTEASTIDIATEEPTTLTVSAISLNFDYVTSNRAESRADEIRVLLVKNKKPSRKSKEGKPGGLGMPTGQVESKESMEGAVERETRHESGYRVRRIVGKAFIIHKRHVNNEIHVHIIESHDMPEAIRERDEIDSTIEPWFSLRQAFEMPVAQGLHGENKNPDGMYFSHRQRLYWAIEAMVYDLDSLIDSEAISRWVTPHRGHLLSAMIDLEKAGLLRPFTGEEDGESGS